MRLLKLVPDHTNVDFMRWRNVAVVVSTLMTILSLAYTAYRGLNMGVDFVGGQMIRVSFAQPINVEQLRSRVDGLQLGESSIQEFGGPKTYQIRLPKASGGDAAANVAATRVKTMVTSSYPGARIDSVESVSGKVSEELAQNGAMAIIFAMLGIAIYIWMRFEWQFGIGALITLAHDIAMTLGFFAFTRLQVDLNVVAAFLTVVGYSLNDTVVIYDRIRENLRKYRKMAILPLLNLSLNETLARTVVTSLTVLIALAVLMAIGPEVIFGLSLAIFLGVVVGTYSSIYVSTPVLVWLGVTPDSFVKTETADGAAPQNG
ncbi:protein translocase subunit SecF [Sphingomonas sp. RG327]|jgi:preprotein translocase subunit SecF|uniref:Protein-export membrane protein SecF n=1 Tax=Sphingomonas anseongensis TaxID=2908207 RepID=A0ABT0RFJ5_9SPHN|nr:protein translocase subunit SecF [Sphingomonas anseongensis]MCL6679031.1 protein translocase subunit SecF [Sphingomonas anseongensis]